MPEKDKTIARDVEDAIADNIFDDVVGQSKEIKPVVRRGNPKADSGAEPHDAASEYCDVAESDMHESDLAGTNEQPEPERLVRVAIMIDTGFAYNLSFPVSVVRDMMDRQSGDFFIELPIDRRVVQDLTIKHRYLHTSRIRELELYDEL